MDRSLNCSRLFTTSPQLQHEGQASQPPNQPSNPSQQQQKLLEQQRRRQASPFAGDGVLHLELHVDSHRAGVDARGVGLVTSHNKPGNLTFCTFPEKRSAVEEMAFFTFLNRSFLVSGQATSFLTIRNSPVQKRVALAVVF
ncbi:hypothetical protein GOODEAATRI_012404, partial [Goodea atripinnis]